MQVKYSELGPDHPLMIEAELWGDEDQEIVTDTDIDDYIENVLEGWGLTAGLMVITAYKVRSLKIDPDGDILDPLLEHIDGEYLDENRDFTKPNEAMKAAAKVFASTIEKEYRVTTCEECGYVNVDIHAWVKEHRPEWLETDGGVACNTQ